MQTRNPLLNDFAELMSDAFGAAQAAGEEAQAVFRAQADRFVADMDLVSRDEFEAVKAALVEAREEIEALKARVESVETAAAQAAKPAPTRKTTARKAPARKAPSKTAKPKSTD
ncbi:accessory factor UbiK family protein [Maricaulis sp. D1M11]|uniref:accessory factor UbiK family protein n=1 Tax=Maricaulis sp. D1M11 TaxID=3076117 RepID=UPI0039B5F3D3